MRCKTRGFDSHAVQSFVILKMTTVFKSKIGIYLGRGYHACYVRSCKNKTSTFEIGRGFDTEKRLENFLFEALETRAGTGLRNWKVHNENECRIV